MMKIKKSEMTEREKFICAFGLPKVKGYAIANESASAWYNSGNFVARSQAKMFDSADNAQAVANIVKQNRKINVRVFYIVGETIREVCNAFNSSAYRPSR